MKRFLNQQYGHFGKLKHRNSDLCSILSLDNLSTLDPTTMASNNAAHRLLCSCGKPPPPPSPQASLRTVHSVHTQPPQVTSIYAYQPSRSSYIPPLHSLILGRLFFRHSLYNSDMTQVLLPRQ